MPSSRSEAEQRWFWELEDLAFEHIEGWTKPTQSPWVWRKDGESKGRPLPYADHLNYTARLAELLEARGCHVVLLNALYDGVSESTPVDRLQFRIVNATAEQRLIASLIAAGVALPSRPPVEEVSHE